MYLIAKIKFDQLNARKNKDAAAVSLLTTLIGESEMVGKNAGNRETTDAEVVAVIKKFLKNARDTIKVLETRDEHGKALLALSYEVEILESYLPKQFNEEVLTQVLRSIKNEISAGPKDMGKMLSLLKTRFDGQYDGKMASEVTRKLLT